MSIVSRVMAALPPIWPKPLDPDTKLSKHHVRGRPAKGA
jgi:hypothetical protein